MASNLQIILCLIVLFSLIFALGWSACYIWHTDVISVKKEKHLK